MTVNLHRTTNNAIGLTQNNPLSSSGTNLIVDSTLDGKLNAIGSFPFFLTVWSINTTPNTDPNVEIVNVTARVSPNNYTITRAQQGTAAAAHAMLSNVGLLWTKGNTGEVIPLEAIGLGSIIVYDASGIAHSIPVGSNGKILTADSGQTYGVGWDSPAAPVIVPTMKVSTIFETSARFVNGSAWTFGAGGANITVGASTTSYISIANTSISSVTNEFNGNPTASCSMYVGNGGVGTGTSAIWFNIGAQQITALSTSVLKHIGFKLIFNSGTASLYATQADGTTENVSSALVSGIAAGSLLDLLIQVTSSGVNYYCRINGGTQSTVSLTSNQPTGGTSGFGSGYMAIGIGTGTSAGNNVFAISMSYER